MELMDPKEMEETQDAIARSYHHKMTAIVKLTAPLQQYADQGDLAHKLALKAQVCDSLRIMLKNQRDENPTLQVMIKMHMEKEAIAATSSFTPPPALRVKPLSVLTTQPH